MDYIKPYLDYFSANPEWAIAIVFLIAFGEALLIIGLFVPSTAVLVGAGMLVGTGHLGFWPVFIATSAGAIIGDQVSYWAGRLYGSRLKTLWPLNRYPALVARGEDFVRDHGGKSIAIGRFVPGVKAVVPGIVGMLGMNQLYFVFVNFTSGVFWGAAHVFPGILLGQGLALAGELSHRLVVVLVVLLVILAVAGWLIRIAAAGFAPYLNNVLRRISVRARQSNVRAINRFGRALSPDNPRSMLIVVFSLIAFAGVLAVIDLVTGLVVRNAVSNLDVSLASIMRGWRNAPADELMVRLSMLGDPFVVWALGISVIVWLFFWRAWRASLVALGILLCGEALIAILGVVANRPSPVFGLAVVGGNFPSAPTLMSGLVFGLIAVLASHSMGRWSKAVVAAICGSLVVAIAFSRVYLGADWLSGVLGGLLIAAILSAVFGVVIEAIPSRRIRPLGLMAVSVIALIVAGSFHIGHRFEATISTYGRAPAEQIRDAADWARDGWQQLPARRIDLAGEPEEVFPAQWVGDVKQLQQVLEAQGWKPVPKWGWRDALPYLDPETPLADLMPRPLLHRGFKAKLTMVRGLEGQPNRREVMRAYSADVEVSDAAGRWPVYLISFTNDVWRPRFHLYSVPGTELPPDDEIATLMAGLEKSPSVKVVARAESAVKPRTLLQATMP